VFGRQVSIIIASVLLFACSDSEQSQNINKPYHVGILAGVDLFDSAITGFKDEMATMGYHEGKNVTYTISRAKGIPSAMKKGVKNLVDKRVDLIFTVTNGAALAAKKGTEKSQIPVVFGIVMAPVRSGVVNSLTNPTGNVTGVRNPLAEFIGKRLDILRQIAPSATNVLILNNPNYPTIPVAKEGLRATASLLNFKLIDVPVHSSQEIQEFLSQVETTTIDAILIMPDTVVQSKASLKIVYDFANKQQIPVIANTTEQVKAGALFSYLTDTYETGREAAQLANRVLAKKILHGQPISNSEPQLMLNLKAAKILGLTVNDGLINLSHDVIE